MEARSEERAISAQMVSHLRPWCVDAGEPSCYALYGHPGALEWVSVWSPVGTVNPEEANRQARQNRSDQGLLFKDELEAVERPPELPRDGLTKHNDLDVTDEVSLEVCRVGGDEPTHCVCRLTLTPPEPRKTGELLCLGRELAVSTRSKPGQKLIDGAELADFLDLAYRHLFLCFKVLRGVLLKGVVE
jgi:hypothetical protein